MLPFCSEECCFRKEENIDNIWKKIFERKRKELFDYKKKDNNG